MSNSVVVNIQANTSGLQAALSSATSQLATFASSATSSASSTSRLGAAASTAATQINTFNITVNNSSTVVSSFSGATAGATGSVSGFLGSFAALGALQKFTNLLNESKDAVIKAEKSFKGLEATAASVGIKIGDAMQVVKEITKDGLMDNTAASKSLQNLLAYGFSLKEAETLLRRLKDSSAFNAQGTMSVSEAVERATEGIKNENSALIDNAGVTKNASVMFEEYAGKHGLVSTALSNSEKRAALLGGVIDATNGQVGNAAKLAETLGGQVAAADAKMITMKETIGQAFTPAFQALNTVMGVAGDGIVSIIKTIQNLGAASAWAVTQLAIFGSWFKDFDTTRVRKELNEANKTMQEFLNNQYKASGAQFNADPNATMGKPKADADDTAKEKFEKAKQAYELMKAEAKKERETKEKQYELDLATFKNKLDNKLISLEAYKKEALRINGKIEAAGETYFTKIANGLTKWASVGFKPKESEIKVAQIDNEKDRELARIKSEKDRLAISGTKISGGGGASSGDSIAKAQYEQEKTLRDLALEKAKAYHNQILSLNEYQFHKFKINADTYYSTLNKYLTDEFNQQQTNTKADILSLEAQKKKTSSASEKIKIDTEISKLNAKLIIDETQFKQKYDENTRALKSYNEELSKQKALKDIDSTRANKDTDLSIRKIQSNINRSMGEKVDPNEDKIIENARFQATKEAIQARRQYILENEKENTQELLNLDKELEEAQRQHILSIAQLNADAFLQSKQNYLDFMSTSKSAVAGFFVEMNKHPKNFKDAVFNAFDTIHQKIMSMIAENWAKKLFDSDSVKNPLNSFMNMMGFGGMQKQPDLKDDSVKANNPEVAKMTTELTGNITEKLSTMFDGVSSMFSNFFSGLGNVLNSVFSSLSSAGGGGGSGGGLFSMIGSFFSGVPALATGTNYVPQDNMLAFLHKGEAVVPAAYNNDKMGRGGNSTIINFTTQQAQSRYSQNQQAALMTDALNRSVYNR